MPHLISFIHLNGYRAPIERKALKETLNKIKSVAYLMKVPKPRGKEINKNVKNIEVKNIWYQLKIKSPKCDEKEQWKRHNISWGKE